MSTPEEGKVFDTIKKEWVDPKPAAEPKKDTEPEPKKDDNTPTPEEVAAAAAAKAAGKEEPKKEEPKKTEDKTDPKKDELPAWLKEKYGIETQEELEEVLSSNDKLADELEKERNKKVFTSEKEEKLHKFLKDWDLDKISEGMQTAATLLSMDIGKIDARRALEEAYILENTDLTREEAKTLFAKQYKKNYELNKDKFDSDEEYEEEKKIVEIQLKKDVAKAKKLLEEKKEALKAKDEKKEEKKGPEVPEEGVRNYTKQVNKFFEKFEAISETDEEGNELYSIPLTEDQRKKVKESMLAYVQRADVYDKSGKISNFEPDELASTFAEILFKKYMREQRSRQISVLAQSLKAEQIAGRKPDKKSMSQGKASGLSLEEQFRERAKIEKAKREQARG